MHIWSVDIEIAKPLEALPVPHHVELEEQDSPAYHCDGRFRSFEPKSLFFYTISGSGCFRDRKGERLLGSGDGFVCRLCKPDPAYYFPEDGTRPWRFLWFTFSGKSADDIIDDFTALYGHVFSLPPGNRMIRSLLSNRAHDGNVLSLSPFAGARMVLDVLAEIEGSFIVERAAAPNKILARKAQAMLVGGIENGITVPQVAAEFKISREHFSRIFKEETGMTPLDYMMRQKILKACIFLKETKLSSKEIAARLGYEQSTNFIRAFSKVLRLTPAEFREHGVMPLF